MKILLLYLAIVLSYTIYAQPYKYDISQRNYQDLSTTNNLWGTSNWSYDINSIPWEINLGFNFEIFSKINNTTRITNTGVLSFSRDNINASDAIYMMGTKLKSKTEVAPFVSFIGYKREGEAPNRTFTVEYKNVGFEFSSDTSFYTNFQVRLFETSNKIEIHYGPTKNDSSCFWYNKGAYIGMDTINGWTYFLMAGDPQNPTWMMQDTILNGAPLNGTVYTFTPIATSIKEVNNIVFSIYPNPTQNSMELSSNAPILNINITDLTGKNMLVPKTFNGLNAVLETNNLLDGMYIIEVQTQLGVKREKFYKQ